MKVLCLMPHQPCCIRRAVGSDPTGNLLSQRAEHTHHLARSKVTVHCRHTDSENTRAALHRCRAPGIDRKLSRELLAKGEPALARPEMRLTRREDRPNLLPTQNAADDAVLITARNHHRRTGIARNLRRLDLRLHPARALR